MDNQESNSDRPASSSAKPALVPQQRIGNYVLLEKLGAGGIGEVWKARDRRLNRIVALKFISAERQGSSPIRELLKEARAASVLNHPNIVTVFEVGEAEGGTYLAMEFVEGETLRARLKHSAIPLGEAIEILTQVANGLATAHRNGIIHRDLKPENIMLRLDGYVKLLDFGLAKILPWSQQETADSSAVVESTGTGYLVGTFNYMSPEQARGLAVSPASDVFSFGIVVYEMLSGEHPFRAATALDTLNAILNKEPPSVSSRTPGIPPQLSDIVSRALRKDSSERFPSAVELAEQLHRARAAQPAAVPALPSAVKAKPRWMQALGAFLIAAFLLVGWFQRDSVPSEQASAPVQSVAVMTFRTDAADARASVLAVGLPEDLGSALARTGLRVASRSSVLELGTLADPREVGSRLGVDAVLEGTVRSYGSKVRIHIELASTRTRFQIWSETFTVEGEELLSGEQKTAAEIASQLRTALAAPR